MKNKNGPFEHQEVEGMSELVNLEYVPLEQQQTGTGGELQESKETISVLYYFLTIIKIINAKVLNSLTRDPCANTFWSTLSYVNCLSF